MADQTEQFLKSWAKWRDSLPADQRWMADAIGWSATHSGDVKGYQQSQWSWGEQMGSWLRDQKSQEWQQWSAGWNAS